MKKKLPYLIAASALLISCTGSFFSIYGLGKLFGGHQMGATIIAFAFEFGNIVTATSLKFYWDNLPKVLKVPLIVTVVLLTILTSMGIYGYLSDGYRRAAIQDEIVTKKANLVSIKKASFETRVNDNKNEILSINNALGELSKGYNQNSQTQQVVKGQIITNVVVSNKRGLEQQMNNLNRRKAVLDSVNNIFADSIQKLELDVIEIQSSSSIASELGPLKYISDLSEVPMNKLVNWLILLIVCSFQPLAIMLIITAIYAFKELDATVVPQPKEEPKDANITDPSPDENDKPKRKRKPKRVLDEDFSLAEVISDGPVTETPKPKKTKRKVVDTTLTPDIATAISNSLTNKKKL